ncbi:HNH endonuclease family protein [Aeromicrobium wangtongii]|uniref:HNH endonuclease family protein n=1 Tax=Aeromicrobium wangtongii TaxID=2969247 RepID=A0ABY5ME49_9ACTN|nr:HNH endonuclease family protein [Aeromicrobium wangtongii]MCD9197960.1 HNH endonuclease family protein [Aeromicrobium wangtongii]UUP15438.1 HNH endonuclease family protein [Aeromicrobium wangtongii]
MPRTPRPVALLAVVLAAVILGWYSWIDREDASQAAPSDLPATSAPDVAGAPGTGALASEALAQLAVKGRAPRTGYSREQFGRPWRDLDRNGCDQRNDVLRRDLSAISLKPGTRDCVVQSGVLVSPYSGRSVAFTRGSVTSRQVPIDHVVALSDAWQKGAQQWTADRREQFANDFLELVATDETTNSAKSDGDAATWLPPLKSSRCAYVARQVAIKAEYRLWVTAAERDAMRRVLAACPDERLPSGADRLSAPA